MNPTIVTFLGSRGPYPGSNELPSVLISHGGRNLLLDAGEGVQHRLLHVGKSVASVNPVLVTHMHGDHVLGLIPLLQSRSLAGVATPLLIIGPAGLGSYLTDSFNHLRFEPGYELTVLEVAEGVSCRADEVPAESIEEASSHEGRVRTVGVPCGVAIKEGPFRITPFWVRHSIPTLAFRLDVGESLSLCYVSDTLPSEDVERFCSGVKVLIHDSTFSNELSDKAGEYMHSTALQASEVALRCGAETLILYHASPRYKNLRGMEEEARKVFRNAYAAEKFMKLYLMPNR
ncbi:MAG: ribonuclease Z [Zestosphaera sp.]